MPLFYFDIRSNAIASVTCGVRFVFDTTIELKAKETITALFCASFRILHIYTAKGQREYAFAAAEKLQELGTLDAKEHRGKVSYTQ